MVVFQQYSAGKEKPKTEEVVVKNWSEAAETHELTPRAGGSGIQQ